MNLSNRKIVDVDRRKINAFRAPEAQIVGIEFEEEKTESTTMASISYRDDIGVPRNLQVDEQTLRTEQDGSSVVDVVLSFEGARGASSHEVRISKL